ncbi:MAG TPA: hypothetical protein VIH99_11910 [Bdellovibrionota bacterium]
MPYLLAALLGVLISAYPHFHARVTTGSFAWIADQDEAGLYLPIASQSYWNHPQRVADPLFTEIKPANYPWMQFAPFSAVARLLSLPPTHISLLWRLFAGASLGLAWLFALRIFLGGSPLAFPLALLLLVDSGLLESKLLLKQYLLLKQAFFGDGSIFSGKPELHPEWRIITPGLSLFALLLFFGFLRKGVEKPADKQRQLWAAISLGLLFYCYFFYWTAACGGLLIALLIDRKRWQFYATTLFSGTVIGSLEIFRSWQAKNAGISDWLQRTDKFLPIPHFSELIIPKIGFLLLALSFVYVWKKKSELRFLWAQACAGLLLLNHQIVSGLQIENFHWAYHWGPALSLLLAVMAGQWLASQRFSLSTPKRYAIYAFFALHVAGAFTLRHLEITRSADSVDLNSDLRAILGEGPLMISSHEGIAGDRNLVELFSIQYNLRPLSGYIATLSPNITDAEWHRRVALNAVVSGFSAERFVASQAMEIEQWVWGPWARSPNGRTELFDARMNAFKEVKGNLQDSIRKRAVYYVVVRSGSSSRPLGRKIHAGPGYDLYEL